MRTKTIRLHAILGRSISALFRIGTLLSKFGLIFVLARFLPPDGVGLFGLFAASIAYALMALGLDFYSFANREIATSEKTTWGDQLRDQGVFYLLAYVALLPLLLSVFKLELLPRSTALWFFPLLIAEHIAQELNRLLIAIQKPLWASAVLFIRSGSWALIIAALLWLLPSFRTIESVLTAWITGSSIACIIALICVKNEGLRSPKSPVNWNWILRGIKIAIPFATATLAFRAIYTIDRYWIEKLGSADTLAPYILFAGIANAINNIVDALVISFQYPKLIDAAKHQDKKQFNTEMSSLWRNTLFTTLALAAGAIFLSPYLVAWINKPMYSDQMHILYWAVAATALYSASLPPHFGLYSLHADRPIVFINLASLPVFIGSSWALIPFLGYSAVLAGLVISSAFILVTKSVAFHQLNPYNKR